MRLAHFERLAPICPGCRQGALFVSKVVKGTDAEVDEGLLECRKCQHLFPVLDGIPLLLRDLRRVVAEQLVGVIQRDDLSETTLGWIGECCGSGSPFDSTRHHLSSYSHGHWEDGSVAKVLEAGLAKLGKVEEPILDVGCSVGRTSVELSKRGFVLGVDLNIAMLRAARRYVKEGRARYARRVSGLVYEERDVSVGHVNQENLDFWCADAQALPFVDGTFSLATSLNLIDCVQSPLAHLQALSSALKPGASALVATPFDWSAAVTPVEQWLGGHSKRTGPEVVRALCGSEQLRDLRVETELDGLDWPVWLHERAEMRYRVALFVLKKLPLSA